VGEQRRYTAFGLVRARERLRAELPALAARGLRPSWMVWLPRRPGWRLLRRGELVVQFEPVAEPRPGTALPRILNPLLYGLREVIGLQREAIDTLEALASERGAEHTQEPSHDERRAELERRCRRLERTTREIELELKRIESWLEQ
jgi:hypothetical protein